MSDNHIKSLSNIATDTVHKAFGKPKSRSKVLSEIKMNPDTLRVFESFRTDDQERIILFLTGEKTLQILSDRFFRKIMNPDTFPERVESLISAVFNQKVHIIKVLPREGVRITDEGSQVIMDIVVRLEDGSITTVEMQRLGYLFPGERSSCYLADILMRQYEAVRNEKKETFSYRDLKPVNLIVIMENSTDEFKKAAPEYLHKRITTYSSGVHITTLENVTYISLDTFKKKAENKLETTLDAWLHFFTAETPGEVLRLIEAYPEFLPMYQDIAEFRKHPEEVIGMFSEALRIMDRNTTKYMIDDLHQQLDDVTSAKEDIERYAASLEQDKAALEERVRQLEAQIQA